MNRLAMANALVGDLPATSAAWQAGVIDSLKARTIAETSYLLPGELRGTIGGSGAAAGRGADGGPVAGPVGPGGADARPQRVPKRGMRPVARIGGWWCPRTGRACRRCGRCSRRRMPPRHISGCVSWLAGWAVKIHGGWTLGGLICSPTCSPTCSPGDAAQPPVAHWLRTAPATATITTPNTTTPNTTTPTRARPTRGWWSRRAPVRTAPTVSPTTPRVRLSGVMCASLAGSDQVNRWCR
ncbi:MAG: hypothetical protein ACRDQI_12810 [Pseudonocardiaceae bacterium]